MADHRRDRFETTRWSLVLATVGQSTEAREALATLCAAYWFPLYVFLRRRGHPPEDAEDLTQGFFGHLLERQSLQVADPQRGRFRSFLLASLQHYAINEHARATAARRGGGLLREGLEVETAEGRFTIEPRDDETPERSFDRRWALTLLDRVLARCKREYERAGKGDLFARLRPVLSDGAGARPYAEIAGELGMSEGAIQVAVHRLRTRYRQLLRDEVAQTVSSPDDVDAEIRYLLDAVRRPGSRR